MLEVDVLTLLIAGVLQRTLSKRSAIRPHSYMHIFCVFVFSAVTSEGEFMIWNVFIWA